MPGHVARWLILAVALTGIANRPAWGQREGAPRLSLPDGVAMREEVYKTVDGVTLSMQIYQPVNHQAGDRRAAIVFFFGGGWRNGSTGQFAPHAAFLASRGMVAMTADYRVHSRHQVKVSQCVADARSAIRWVRSNAGRLGIDPDRIAAGGGSAGGHLAAATATISSFDEPDEDLRTIAKPNALALFNPALDLTPAGFGRDDPGQRGNELYQRLGAAPEALSPQYYITDKIPPTIIFHGTADTVVPFAQAEAFCRAMQEAGNRCTVAAYEGQGHGFFNHGRGDGRAYTDTLRKLDEFLIALGYLEGQPAKGQE
jgi:acetyl esterase